VSRTHPAARFLRRGRSARTAAQLRSESELRAGLDARRRQRAIDSFREFVRQAWPYYENARDLVWSPHLDVICDYLQRFGEGRIKRLFVNIPPRHSKSTLAGVLLPAWIWLRRPESQYLCLTKADDNARRDARAMRRVVTSAWFQAVARQAGKQVQLVDSGDGWYRALPRDDDKAFDSLGLLDDQAEIRYYGNTRGGYRISQTTGSAVTGKGCDVLIVDDPYDALEVATGSGSQVRGRMRDVRSRYRDVWLSRLNSAASQVLLIMQRLHKEDLAAEMLADGAVALVLPFYFEPEHPNACPDDYRTIPGEKLTEHLYGDDVLAKFRQSPALESGQLQQRPRAADGGKFRDRHFRQRYDCEPHEMAARCEEVLLSVDASGGGLGSGASWNAIEAWGRIGQALYLLGQRRGRWELPELEAQFKAACSEWPTAHTKLIEDKALGRALIQRLRSGMPGIVPVNPGQVGGKEVRAGFTLPVAAGGNLWLPESLYCPWIDGWIEEHKDFPGGDADDQVDTASQACMWWAGALVDPKEARKRAVGWLANVGRPAASKTPTKKPEPPKAPAREQRRGPSRVTRARRGPAIWRG